MRALEIDDVARTCLMNCVRTRDAQYQWARTSLKLELRVFLADHSVAMLTC